MARTPKTILYDQKEQYLVANVAGSWFEDTTVITMFRNDHYALTLQVYNDAPTTANLASINTSTLQLDIGLLGSAPYVTSSSTNFTATNAASGELICNVNTHSSTLTTALTTNEEKWVYCDVIGTDDSIGSSQVLVHFVLKARNVTGTGS